jgi:hypothetical protein
MNIATTIANTPEYKQYFNQYKTNLLKYQPGRWYFDNIEKGIGFHENISLEEMKKMAKKVSPIGPAVLISEIENVTPSYDQICKQFPGDIGYSYQKYTQWISEQDDIFYYARGREDYSAHEAYLIASKLGYRKIITEDLS